MKKCGEINELSKEEILYIISILGSSFKYYGQLGRSGARTSAYLFKDSNDNKYVVKLANDEMDKKWSESQKNTLDTQNKITEGYNGDIALPSAIKIGENYTIENYLGVEFTKEIYDNLPSQERLKLEQDFGDFLAFIHSVEPYKTKEYFIDDLVKKLEKSNLDGNISMQYTNDDLEKYYQKKLDLGEYSTCSFEQLLEYFMPYMSESQIQQMQKNIDKFNIRDKTDEIIVNTHSDIRSQNVLYDEDTKRLAIIDFESMGYKNLYRDFVPNAAASFGISYEFLHNATREYNKKSDFKVDLDKVKLLHTLGVFHEYGRVSLISKDNPLNIARKWSIISSRLKEIEKTFVDKENLCI